ncbi:MAG: NAD(P)-dependent oxidoreductase [Propylenella sp.]
MASNEGIGFIGIGAMGWHMATNIIRAGFDVSVADSNAAQRDRFVREHGGSAAGSLAELGKKVGVVITMLPTGQIVRSVLLEEEGGALAKSLRRGSVVIDMSSSEPTGTRRLAGDLKARGITLVDAPVSGGVIGAEEARLTIMIGGDDEKAVARVTPILAAMGPRHFRTGGAGSGHAMKALNNLMSGAGFILMSEALVIGKRFGLDPTMMANVINESTGRNHATANLANQEVISRRFGSKFMLGLMAKDVKIAADLAEDLKAHAPMARLVRDLWLRAREHVGAGEDHTSAVRYWEELNGVTLGPPEKAKGRAAIKGRARAKAKGP